MKVKKKWKKYVHQIALACLLICCIATCVPQTVKAELQSDQRQSSNEWDFSYVNSSGKDVLYKIKVSGNSPVYAFCYDVYGDNAYKNFGFISKSEFKISREYYYDGKLSETVDLNTYGKDTNCKHYGAFYRAYDTFTVYPKQSYYRCLSDTMKGLINKYPEKYTYAPSCFFAELLNNEQIPEYIECVIGDDSEGGVNNPIENDEEIGTPIITKRRYTTVYHDTDMGNASDGKEDIDDSQFIFDWSNKTSTGFNLKKNKYHMTRIQIKVQSKCVVYSGFSHKTVKKRFDNYGEMSSEIKSALVDDTPYSIEYGTVKSMLPKTFSEKHNPLYVGRNFTFYFRVMCNESASGTGKWHCGPWRAVGLNASTTLDQTDDSSNGHIDSDGNYTKDPDDGHNNSDSDSSTVDDKDDAKDQFKDDQKNDVTNGKNDSSGFEWSDLKKLVNECKEVPGLIKSIFSFLPDWVLVFVAVGFGIWIFVLIKRAIV